MKRPRRIGGRTASQKEREQGNLWRTFLAAAGQTFIGTWRDQCFCGSVIGKFWRGAFWCVRCGREKVNFPHCSTVTTK
jgi:hypothetical protein